MQIQAVSYHELRSQLQTGDIVLFSGKGTVSRTIQVATRSPWSHVGMVVIVEEYNLVLLLESTTLSCIENLSTDSPKSGVQMVSLSSRLSTYEGIVAIRRLLFSRDAHFKSEVVRSYAEFKQRNYEESKLSLLLAALDSKRYESWFRNKMDTSSLFCSELVAAVLQAGGCLPASTPASEFTPADFADDHLPWQPGCCAGESVLVLTEPIARQRLKLDVVLNDLDR